MRCPQCPWLCRPLCIFGPLQPDSWPCWPSLVDLAPPLQCSLDAALLFQEKQEPDTLTLPSSLPLRSLHGPPLPPGSTSLDLHWSCHMNPLHPVLRDLLSHLLKLVCHIPPPLILVLLLVMSFTFWVLMSSPNMVLSSVTSDSGLVSWGSWLASCFLSSMLFPRWPPNVLGYRALMLLLAVYLKCCSKLHIL